MIVEGRWTDAKFPRQRRLKMARSAHAYVHGNTARFYAWLQSERGLAMPQGPAVWICGDCHVGNLGPVADAKGRVVVQTCPWPVPRAAPTCPG